VFVSRLAPETSGIAYYLPRSLVTVDTDRTEGTALTSKTNFTFAEQTIADTRQRYVLNYQGDPFFKDRLCVVVGTSGFLSSIEYASEDTTPRIAVALAELAAKTISVPSARPPGAGFAPRPITAVEKFSVTFDPLDTVDLDMVGNRITRELQEGSGDPPGTKYSIDFPDAAALKLAKRARGQNCDGKGVCFRTKIRTMVRVLKQKDPTKDEKEAFAISTVDMVGPVVGNIDLDRLFLVEKVTRLKFEEGALTEFIMRRPSQALQAAKLPLDILDVLLAVPTNFIGNLTGTKEAQEAYVTSLQNRTEALRTIQTNLAAIGARTAPENGVEPADSTLFQLKCNGQLIKPAT
jgi:hypothetical protein